ncbi:MAG TPA: two-component regulator propeller domain-containing protein [Thermohalobaculum sp.]|nr:two-component regulator propeller domain-containing protein [Thermohalobaculum sp.]
MSLVAVAAVLAAPAIAMAQASDAGSGHAAQHGGSAHTAIPAESGGESAVGGLKRAIAFEIGQRNVKSILIDGRDVWIGSSGGAIRYDTHRGTYLTYDNKSGLLSNGVFHISKVNGEIWAGTYGGGLSVLNPESGKWRNYNIPNGMGDAFVYDALETADGDVWIATWSGANRILGGAMDDFEKWELYTVENTGGGLPNDWVYGLAAGKNGEVWLATEGGLARFVDGKWTNWTHAAGLGAPLEQVEADIAFANDPAEVSSHHARQKQEQGLGDVKVAYNPNYIVSLAVADDGSVWAGTWGAGLSRFDGENWQTFTVADGLPSNHVYALHNDGDGRLWIGTSAGLALLGDAGFQVYGHETGLNIQSIFSIETSGKTVWAGGFGGVTWFPNGVE